MSSSAQGASILCAYNGIVARTGNLEQMPCLACDGAWKPVIDNAYYAASLQQRVYPHLIKALKHLQTPAIKVAVDMGCGAGRDSCFLLSQGFQVHAFDINASAIADVKLRFSALPDQNLSASVSSFDEFDYPACSLIVACSSLYFCPPDKFETMWGKVVSALVPGGVFCGHFLGPDDTWAQNGKDTVLSFDRGALDELFRDFTIVDIYESNAPGKTLLGKSKHWHSYSVVAEKR